MRSWLGIKAVPALVRSSAPGDRNHDARATEKAIADARDLLEARLPEVAPELRRQADVVAAAHADLDGDLAALASVLTEFVNPRGVLARARATT